MKYNKRLLLIIGVSTVLFIGSLLAFTSCNKKPSEDTNTIVNDQLKENNDSNDEEQNNNSEENENVDDNTSDENTNNEEIQDGKIDHDKTEQDEENINKAEDTSSNSNSNNSQSSNSNNNNSGNSTATDKVGNSDEKPSGNMEINNEGIYSINGHYYKSISPLDEKSVLKAANYINSLKEAYLTDNNKVFYAIIPDKTYFDKSSGYDKLDYDRMITILNENIKNIGFIKLKDLLSIDDFYKTDNHWRQESIIDVANRIGENFNFKISANSFEKKSYSDFKGMYSKHVTDKKLKEELLYLTNTCISNATVDNYQNTKFTGVYDTNRLATDISYDVFLSGATPFLTITNSSASSDKELVIFRDSYTSSLAPLLISEYNKITLIDTRYMASTLIKDFIEFDNQDVLFLYSSAIVNNSTMLK